MILRHFAESQALVEGNRRRVVSADIESDMANAGVRELLDEVSAYAAPIAVAAQVGQGGDVA